MGMEIWCENRCGKWHFLVWNRVRIWRKGQHSPSTLSSTETPAGYPYKNSNNRKNRKRGGRLFLARSLFFSPQPPHNTKRPLWRRELPPRIPRSTPQAFDPTTFKVQKKKFKDFSRACKEIQVLFSKKFKDFSRLCESCLKKLGAKMVELSKVHHWPHLSNENKRDISV